MGWGTCGRNPLTGEMMGYCYSGECTKPDCEKVINHGLSYVCGGMHGGGEWGCGRYFCADHLHSLWFENQALDDYMTGGTEYDCHDRQVCSFCYNEMVDALIENLRSDGYSIEVVDVYEELKHVD